jgi:hypothetical protein
LPEYLIGHFLCLLPLSHIGLYLLIDPLSDFVTERSVGLVEVGRVVLHIDVSIISKDPADSILPTGTTTDRHMGSGRHTGPKPRPPRLLRMAGELRHRGWPLA